MPVAPSGTTGILMSPACVGQAGRDRLASAVHPPAVFALLLVALPSVVAAQRASDTTVTRRPSPLPPVVITATRVALPATTVAATVLSGDALRARGITHVADALRAVPGLAVVQTGSFGGATALYIRGGESGYTRVLIDGVPVNDPGGDFDFSQLTTEDVDRIEIVRGPASVLYGSDAVSGVVQIFTRRGAGTWQRATVRAGTYGTWGADAAVEGGDASKGYTLSATSTNTRGIYPFNNAYGRRAVTGTTRLLATNDTKARLLVQYAHNDVHLPTDGTGAPADSNAHQDEERSTVGLQVDHTFDAKLRGSLSLGWHASNGGYIDPPDGPADTLGVYASRSHDHITRKRIEALLTYAAHPASALTLGASTEQQSQTSLNTSQSQFGDFDGTLDAERTTSAVFAQVVGQFHRFSWTTGARLDHDDAFGSYGTYRVGAAMSPLHATRLRAAVGTAFREPTFFQNFATGIATGNPHLLPEHVRSWELGVDRQLWTDGGSLSATYFHQRLRDLIEYSGAAPPGEPNYFNVAAARASGAEIEVRTPLIERVEAVASYTMLSTSVDSPGFDTSQAGYFRAGETLLRRPSRTASVALTYRAPRIPDATLRWTRVGERDDIDYGTFRRVTLTPYTLVDASARISLTRAGAAVSTHLSLRVANVFDTRYEAVSGYRAPGRTVTVALELEH